MYLKRTSLLVLALLAGCQGDTSGSSSPDPQLVQGDKLAEPNNGDIVLSDIQTVIASTEVRNKLIGGDAADPKDWPASFTTSQGNSRCTGTMIGPRTLQLAAHCVGNGRAASINYKGKSYTSVCTHSPNYANNATADYALCSLSESLDLPWYESILTPETNKIKVGDKIVLAGMGCTQPGGGGGNNNVFRVGEAPVTRMPSGTNNDIVTQGKSALCFGDSGGSAFWEDDQGILRIAGVNSRGDIRTTSYLSAVFTPQGSSFYKSWAERNKASICGLDPEAKKCRGDEIIPPPPPPPPPPGPVPAWCKAAYDAVGKCIFGEPRDSLTKPEECRETYINLFACQLASERTE